MTCLIRTLSTSTTRSDRTRILEVFVVKTWGKGEGDSEIYDGNLVQGSGDVVVIREQYCLLDKT
jgi:hypothetical protein